MIRRLAGLAVAGLFVCAAAVAEEKGRKVSYPSGSETVSRNLWAPGGSGKKPALVRRTPTRGPTPSWRASSRESEALSL